MKAGNLKILQGPKKKKRRVCWQSWVPSGKTRIANL